MSIEVYAGPEKAWYEHSKKIVDSAAVLARHRQVEIIFPKPRLDGNRTYGITIRRQDFETLAKAMMSAHSETAIKAFGAALQLGFVDGPPDNQPDQLSFKSGGPYDAC
jgi:hypothetical protein